MAIPASALETMKDLLLYNDHDTSRDIAIADQWEDQKEELARAHDFFFAEITLAAAVNQSVYAAPENFTRILSVAFNQKTLGYADRVSLGLADADWELAEPGEPKRWSFNAVPGEFLMPGAEVTAKDFIITPAPDGAQATPTSLYLIYGVVPDEVPLWVEPIILYDAVHHQAQENPNLMEPEKAEWFNKLSDLWAEVAAQRLPV